MSPRRYASPSQCDPTIESRVRLASGSFSRYALSVCLLLGLSLAGCGEDGSQGQFANASHSAQAVASSEASVPLAMPNAEQTDATSASASATGTPSAEGDRNKDTPPRRIERQMGEIADASPGGFRLGSIKVLIDGSTVVEPSNALTEGEPVDVSGYYESDRKTLRATLVRSTRPASEQPAEQAQQTPGQSSG